VLELPGRPLGGARVLVLGAAGGVGHLAVQLARRSGAVVTAVAGSQLRAEELTAMGADEVVVGLEQAEGPFELALESVGGASLARALSLVGARGTVVTFGNSSRKATCFRAEDFYPGEATLRGFYLWHDVERRPPADDLAGLARLVAEGELRVDVDLFLPWDQSAVALERLRERTVRGKAVLTLGEA
jgi:NADPH:quinone reductase